MNVARPVRSLAVRTDQFFYRVQRTINISSNEREDIMETVRAHVCGQKELHAWRTHH